MTHTAQNTVFVKGKRESQKTWKGLHLLIFRGFGFVVSGVLEKKKEKKKTYG